MPKCEMCNEEAAKVRGYTFDNRDIQANLCDKCKSFVGSNIQIVMNLQKSTKSTLIETRKEALENCRSESSLFSSRFEHYLVVVSILLGTITITIQIEFFYLLILSLLFCFVSYVSMIWLQILIRSQQWKNHWFNIAFITDWLIHHGSGCCQVTDKRIKTGGTGEYFYRFIFSISIIFSFFSLVVIELVYFYYIRIDNEIIQSGLTGYYIGGVIGLGIVFAFPFAVSLYVYKDFIKYQEFGDKWVAYRPKILHKIMPEEKIKEIGSSNNETSNLTKLRNVRKK